MFWVRENSERRVSDDSQGYMAQALQAAEKLKALSF
jgi:hypothetical protein